MDFMGRGVVSIKDFSEEEIEHILNIANKMLPVAEGKKKSTLQKEMYWLPFSTSQAQELDFHLKVPCSGLGAAF